MNFFQKVQKPSPSTEDPCDWCVVDLPWDGGDEDVGGLHPLTLTSNEKLDAPGIVPPSTTTTHDLLPETTKEETNVRHEKLTNNATETSQDSTNVSKKDRTKSEKKKPIKIPSRSWGEMWAEKYGTWD